MDKSVKNTLVDADGNAILTFAQRNNPLGFNNNAFYKVFK